MPSLKFSDQTGKSYYFNSISGFLEDSPTVILGTLTHFSKNNALAVTPEQVYAWENQIELLKEKLRGSCCTGNIIFEYDIVRMGKRIDVVLLIRHMVFSLEFKNGAKQFQANDVYQAEDYACNLKNFHKESEDLYVCPILIATEAEPVENKVESNDNKQVFLQRANKNTLMQCIEDVFRKYGTDEDIDFETWYNSEYCPTPTIIEAAVEAYINHSVAEIARSKAGQETIEACEKKIAEIVEDAKANCKKCVCFITGVPGAGKTLVGLDLAAKILPMEDNTSAVYISGNGPLVAVLRKALEQNAIPRKNIKNKNEKLQLRNEVQAFIQLAYQFRKTYLLQKNNEPNENVLIFDEAQRCWNKAKLAEFIKRHMNEDIDMSEPECFLEIMNRRKDWAVIVCLVGLGQDIYDGEVGINEWFRSAIQDYDGWDLYYSDKIFEQIEDKGIDRKLIESSDKCHMKPELHLPVSVRSFKSKRQSEFVDNLLEGDSEKAKLVYNDIHEKYPIFITRDINKARDYIRNKIIGSQRCGIVACSSAQRLRPEGIFIQKRQKDSEIECWFLAPKNDLRSSCALEVVATEFEVQGLEIDYSILCWDADLRRNGDKWDYYNFGGTKWKHRRKAEQQRYLLNAYRVLLTRARQGMVIFVPKGVKEEIDPTRDKRFYDGIYKYLKSCGIQDLPAESSK